jgi:hypothetical protein
MTQNPNDNSSETVEDTNGSTVGSIIDQYVKRVFEYSDTPKVFIEASAYYLISATLGEYFKNPLVPYGAQRPNLWVVLSSKPGRMRRSTVQGLTYRAFKAVIGGEADNAIIEDCTPEGIMDAISGTNLPSYTIHSTEFGAILKRMRSRDYEIGISSIFSKLYYGEGGKQNLSQRSGHEGTRLLPEGLYVTMLTGLQEPSLYFTPDMVGQGLLRRLLIIYVEKGDRWNPPINQLRDRFTLDDIVEKLREKRAMYRDHGMITSLLVPAAEHRVNEEAKRLDKEFDEIGDNVSLYRQTLWEHILKIATIYAIDRGVDMSNRPLLSVRIEDVDKAMEFIKKVESGMIHAIETLGFEEIPTRVEKTTELAVYRAVLEAGREGIGLDALGRKFPGMARPQLSRFTESLVMQGKIVIKPKGQEQIGAGRPPTIFIAKEYAENIQ